MEKTKLIFIYNATCEWCFGNTQLFDIVSNNYDNSVEIDIISGGFPINTQNLQFSKYDAETLKQYHISTNNIVYTKKRDYLKHKSFIPAVAMVVFKERYPEKALQFAVKLHNLYFTEKENSDEAIGKIAEELGYDEYEFLNNMAENKYQDLAYTEYEYYANKFNIKTLPTTILLGNKTPEVMFNGYVCINRLKQIFENENQLTA